MAHAILGGELTRDEWGDICLWRQHTSIEVKGSGSQCGHGFRLNTKQIGDYQRIPNKVWYMFFAYRNKSIRNKRSGKRRTQFSYHNTPVSINRYLASSVEWCLLVDLSIVTEWEKTIPYSYKSVVGNYGMETVDVKRKHMEHFSNGGLATGLSDLGLNPQEFDVLHGEVETTIKVKPDLSKEYRVVLPITTILPSCETNSLRRRMSRRGFKLNKRAL